MPQGYEKPKGRMLIYWGCGEHAGAGQPTVIDFAKMAAGQVPPGMAAMANYRASRERSAHARRASANGRTPRISRPVPASGSLLGAHKVEGNYSPPIGFTLAAGLHAGAEPAAGRRDAVGRGAAGLDTRRATATGYALAMFGATQNGDVVMWRSSKSAAMTPAPRLSAARRGETAGRHGPRAGADDQRMHASGRSRAARRPPE